VWYQEVSLAMRSSWTALTARRTLASTSPACSGGFIAVSHRLTTPERDVSWWTARASRSSTWASVRRIDVFMYHNIVDPVTTVNYNGLVPEKCLHGRVDTINGGLKRRLDCRAIYGQDNKWRIIHQPVTASKPKDAP
jgi:hypothetical protein